MLLTIADLPPPDTIRWIPRRKALVVRGVREGVIGRWEACKRYGLSVEEFNGWERAIARNGNKGLRVTRLKQYREIDRRVTGSLGDKRAAESV